MTSRHSSREIVSIVALAPSARLMSFDRATAIVKRSLRR
jgi:hypothetical protein